MVADDDGAARAAETVFHGRWDRGLTDRFPRVSSTRRSGDRAGRVPPRRKDHGHPVRVFAVIQCKQRAVGTLVGYRISEIATGQVVTDLDSATASDTKCFAKWFHGMLNRGVYLPCSQFEAMFVSAVHSDEDVQQTIAAASSAFADL